MRSAEELTAIRASNVAIAMQNPALVAEALNFAMAKQLSIAKGEKVMTSVILHVEGGSTIEHVEMHPSIAEQGAAAKRITDILLAPGQRAALPAPPVAAADEPDVGEDRLLAAADAIAESLRKRRARGK